MLVALAAIIDRRPLPADEALATAVAAAAVGPFGTLLGLLTLLGELPIWVPLVGLVAAVFWWRGRRSEAALFLLGLSVEAPGTLVKLLVDRPRPPGSTAHDLITSAGFPSGHVTRAVVAAGLLVAFLAWQHARWRWPAVLLATAFVLLMGLSRVAARDHWPTDVLGGVFLGALWLDGLLLARRGRAFW